MRALPLACLLAALTAAVAPPGSAAPPSRHLDVAGDANGSATVETVNRSTPLNQAYADIVAVSWSQVVASHSGRPSVTGFSVTASFSAPPVPPSGVDVLYWAHGRVRAEDSAHTVGPVWFSAKPADGTTPQAALRDNLAGPVRYTPIPAPSVKGSSITWFVPLSALPPELPSRAILRELQFETRVSENLRGLRVPDTSGERSGFNAGVIDEAGSHVDFHLG